MVPDAARLVPNHDSSHPLIRTKLHRPPLPSDYVCRNRLLSQMDKAMDVPLTLVSAGAGTGKSVIVAAWLGDRDLPYAWLSLDGADSNLRRFLNYFIAALSRARPDQIPTTTELLSGPELPPVDVIATCLINEIDQDSAPLVIVLDDYHLIGDTSPVHDLIRFLLEYAPQDLHLILPTRRDPPLALASLRGSGKIAEVRHQDLRFVTDEAAELLTNDANQRLTTAQVEAIRSNVEGWAVGLKLVALACRRAPNIDSFVNQLSGNLPDTTAYLMDEVLTALPAALSGYLIKTAVLDRFCPALLDALHPNSDPTDDEIDGRRFVELIDQSNLFVVPLDINSEWYRYHHQFRDLLLQELKHVCSHEEICALHDAASKWFEQRGSIEEAIKHAVAADDQIAAAEIIERHRNEPLRNDRWWELLEWLDLLPASIKMSRPQLLLCHGWLAYFRLEIDVMAMILRALDGLEVELANPIFVAEKNFFSTVVAYWEGRLAESLRFSEAAIAANPDAADTVAGESRLYRGLALQVTGHTQQALSQLRADFKSAPKGSGVYQTRLLAGMAFVNLLNGDLELAHDCGQQTIAVAVRSKLPYGNLWGEFISGIASFCAGRFRQTSDIFSHCVDRAYAFEFRAASDAYTGVALCHQFNGDAASAEKFMAEGITYAEGVRDPEAIAIVASARARLQLLQGNAKAALRWARTESGEANPIEMLFWIEIPEMTRLRVLIAAGTKTEREKSLGEVVELRAQLEALYMTNQTIQVAVLQALGLAKLGRTNEARTVLIECMELAGETEWIQPFVEAGEPLIGMLESISKTGHHREFIRSVLAAYDQYVAAASRGTDTGVAAPHVPDHVGLTELTNRELDILELLAHRLQNKQIGARLNISTHTVKDHLKHVYQKLEVSNRRDAVAKATRTGLLKNSPPNS